MNAASLWSLRLGFSNKESQNIKTLGFESFLKASFNTKVEASIPTFLDESPKTLAELKAMRQQLKTQPLEEGQKLRKKELQVSQEMKLWWLEKMQTEAFPLREKMTCFWHNHFVATYQKVKVNHWIFQHNQILREHAFGNFKTLTKEIVKSNAMVRYLDNVDNRKGKINENLSRELLELFTLGIGNYSEEDIKNGAKGLAGLGIGDDGATYRKFQQDTDALTYFGQKGTFKADKLIDIIFEQKAAPYLITRKLLKWFIYDNPSEDLVVYYGDYLRNVDFEIQPLLQKIFTEEFAKKTAGSKIKDPLVYMLQLQHELHIDSINPRLTLVFLKQQGMDLFGQLNVKGWNGGKEWLSSQVYLQRGNAADLLCNGKSLGRSNQMENNEMTPKKLGNRPAVSVDFDATGTNKTIISELQNRLLFQTDAEMQTDFESLLKYDFNPKNEGAENAVLRLFNAMVKLPEFQLL